MRSYLAHSLVFIAASLFSITLVAQSVTTPKLIYYGRDAPFPEQFADDVAALEAAGTPIDGTAISFAIRYPDGNFARPFNFGLGGSPEAVRLRGQWDKAWLDHGIEQLQRANPQQITDNFLRFQSRPGDVDFFDDAGWLQIALNFKMAAYAAKQSGLKGIFFDPEPYVEGFAQFEYLFQANRAEYSFDEYAAKARQRGREVMTAINEEYPDITMFSLFLNAYLITPRFKSEPAFGLSDPTLALPQNPYGLLPYFIDGWLDVAAPEARFIDGNERAYYYNSAEEFDVVARLVREEAQVLVSPENRAKYAAQVEVGSAVFLDAYDEDFPDRVQPVLPEGLSWADLFQQNTDNALRTVDNYVWLYAEEGRIWDARDTTPNRDSPRWADKYPFMLPALSQARATARINGPADAGQVVSNVITERTRLKAFAQLAYDNAVADGTLNSINLVRNNEFSRDLDGWGFFDDAQRGSVGTQRWDEAGSGSAGSMLITDSWSSSGFQSLDVQPGEVVWVQADVRRRGRTEPDISVGFRGPDGRFIRFKTRHFFLPEWQPVADRGTEFSDWVTVSGAAVVPAAATGMTLALSAEAQRPESTDAVAFDNVVVLSAGLASDVPPASTNVLDNDPVTSEPPVTPPAEPTVDDPSTNLLMNPGFSDGTSFWSISTGDGSAESAPQILEEESGNARMGVTAANSGVVQTVPARPGGSYTLSASASVESMPDNSFGGGYVGLLFKDAAGKNINGAFRSTEVINNQTEVLNVSAFAPDNAVEIGVFAWRETDGALLLADDFVLRSSD